MNISSAHPQYPGYFNTPWPAEDNGPERLQSCSGFVVPKGAQLRVASRRTQLGTMTILGPDGRVFLMTHSAFRAQLGFATTAQIEEIHPRTLKTLKKSPRLAGGPMWPGGFALHANGSLISVYGRYAHRLSLDCEVIARTELPVNLAYNSFVILDNGLVVTKNLSMTTQTNLSVLDPNTLQPIGDAVLCPEASIARLSARGNTVYIAGMQRIFRYTWSDEKRKLLKDSSWQPDYMQGSPNSYGWDMVLADDSAWLMDNGHHKYLYTMIGAGVNKSSNRLIQVSLSEAKVINSLEISGLKGGSVTNPPLFCIKNKIVVAYDSANRVMVGYQLNSENLLQEIWRKTQFGCASHMVLMSNSDVFWVNDYRRFGEEIVAVELKTGIERTRVRTPGRMQGVVFPSIGHSNDVYWTSMDRLTRVEVAPA